MKTLATILLCLFVSLVSNTSGSSQTATERTIQDLDTLQRLATGVGSTALAAPFGRYFLLRRENELLAIKIIRHSEDLVKSQYEWIWLRGEQREEGVGWLSEKFASREPDFLVIHSFNVKWSSGDWFYLDQAGLEMARTEIVDKEAIAAKVKGTTWYTPESLKRQHDAGLAMFRKCVEEIASPSHR